MEKIVGDAEILLSPEEVALYDQQQAAAANADVWKQDANYQNTPNGDEMCEGCSMFVPGFESDPGGYCTKVRAVRGPAGMIFPEGWCKFFEPNDADDLDVDYVGEGTE